MDFSLFGFHFREFLNLHPIFIHFPIVLFPISFIFYLLAWKVRKEGVFLAAQLLLLLATGSAIVAAFSGYLAGNSIPHNEAIHHLMQTHEKMAYLIVLVGGVLSLWSFLKKEGRPRLYPAFLIVLAILSLTIFQSAELGGRMVYVHGAGVKVAVPLMEPGHPPPHSQDHPETESGNNQDHPDHHNHQHSHD